MTKEGRRLNPQISSVICGLLMICGRAAEALSLSHSGGVAPPSASDNSSTTTVQFVGYKVLAVVPATADQAAWLADFKQDNQLNCSLDWWSEPGLAGLSVSLAVQPDCVDRVTEKLELQGLDVRKISLPIIYSKN